MIYLELFLEFFKAGLFALGGGLATIPFLYEMSINKGWFTIQELTNMIAISEATPGPIGINMATYVGFKTTGSVIGGIIATLGETAPSIISILIVASILTKFSNNYYVKKTFEVIRPVVFGTILFVFISMLLTSVFNIDIYKTTGDIKDIFNIKYIFIFVLLAVLKFKFKKLHPIVFLLIGAALGMILSI